jgi:hypothetical protein
MSKKIYSRFIGCRQLLWIVIPVLVIVLILGGYSYLPLSREQMKHTVAKVERKYYYVLTANNKDVLYFGGVDSDSTFTDASLQKEHVMKKSIHTGCWVNKFQFIPSCEGRVMAQFQNDRSDGILKMTDRSLPEIIKKECDKLTRMMKDLKRTRTNMQYYLRVHNATDAGFNIISRYAAEIDEERDSTNKLLDAITITAKGKTLRIKYISEYSIIYSDDSMKQKKVPCRMLKEKNGEFRFLQTYDATTPDGAKALYFHLWLTWHISKLSSGKIAPNDVPEALADDGAPIFTKFGSFIGIRHKGEVLSTDKFKISLLKLD